MTDILVTLPMHDGTREKYYAAAPDCSFEFRKWNDYTEEAVAGKEIILGNIPPKFIKYADKLRWIQLHSAGNDAYAKDPSLLRDIILTNASGCYGLVIAEYMVGAVIGAQMNLFRYDRAMQKRKWTDEGRIHSIMDSTTVVLGLGNVGSEFAWRMHALGSKVIGVKRTPGVKPDFVDELFTIDRLDEVLPRADILAVTLPATKDTYHMIRKEQFELMKDTALFVNTGRGSVAAEDDLVEALNSGMIGGACLDVYEKEPLPEDDPLWDAKNVFMTPHVSGGWHLYSTVEKINELALRNLQAYLAGGKLENVVDFTRGY
ncbi:MAG: D-2-hydroxyacid dehydrogenase [Eubacteriaceae bacterium]|jgi:phosphoglycerate dehydrogenase-like enzyme|nr:D-2-hydroxyacid dehydrogenase [Eubacteriaceae bacterium]